MVYSGYFRYDGIEIVNVARLTAYAESMRLGFFNSNSTCGSLDAALQVQGFKNSDYESPASGNPAPWYTPLDPYSAEFAGVHVLSIDNIASSTYSATVEEGIGTGGWVQGGRYGTRSMVFRVLLVGSTVRGVNRGLNWLTTVLRNGDPCRNSLRSRHTYNDFLPLGKPWWRSYREDSATALPSSLYQANRFLGLSSTDDPEVEPGRVGSGNTYAKIHSGGEDGFGPDALDILVKLDAPDPVSAFSSFCNGNTMEYFIQCPDAETSDYDYRYMTQVDLTSGPTVLAERNIGGDTCGGGAWMEVEFTLTAANPFAWRKKSDILLSSADFDYRKIAAGWDFYKDETSLEADDDVYQAPLVAGRGLSYTDLYLTVFNAGSGGVVVKDAPPVRLAESVASVRSAVNDPLCPPLPEFPPIPQEDFLCRPLNELGPFNSKRYTGVVDMLDKETPVAVRLTFASITEEYRDLKVRILSQAALESEEEVLELHVLYMPPFSTLVIDGARRSTDILLADELSPTSLRWEPASHLVVTQGGGASYRYPELLCGRNFIVEVGIPEDQDPDVLTVGIEAIGRDG